MCDHVRCHAMLKLVHIKKKMNMGSKFCVDCSFLGKPFIQQLHYNKLHVTFETDTNTEFRKRQQIHNDSQKNFYHFVIPVLFFG